MYQNHVRRRSADRNLRSLSVRLEAMPFNEKAAFVESVCSNLTDSRFGPGRPTPIAIRLSQWPELEPAIFYDMSPVGPVPCFSILPDSEMARRHSVDILCRELAPPKQVNATIHVQRTQPPNQGRGSP